tara:strand:+ start:391 stop:549 length:159 start_codon:yes stop_codon:yes gene_type:complete
LNNGNQFRNINIHAFGDHCFIRFRIEGDQGMPEDNQEDAKTKQKIYERGSQQ